LRSLLALTSPFFTTQSDEDNKPKKPITSRKDRPTGSIHFGDDDFNADEEPADATWGEVFQACCVRSPTEWGYAFGGFLVVCFFLYFFLFGLELMGTSAKVMTGCTAGALFGDETNPVAGLMVGILSTVLLQSSSTTTSIIVSLVGSAISVRQAIYMVMGANIGTTVTNTLVSLGQLGDADQLERAFAGATVHDMFNYMTVCVLFPLEIATGYLRHLTGAMVKNASTSDGETWEGPVKKFVAPLGERIIKSNSKLITAVAKGTGSCDDGDGFYPVLCEPGEPTASKCKQVGLISCNSDKNTCPSFFQPNATAKDDKVSGGVVFFISIVILFTCLLALVNVLQRMLLGLSTRVVHKATNVNGYVAIAVGCGLTILVQSSSVVTSALTPLVGIGAIHLNQMYPLTLGSNIGTTVTALLASMVTEGTESLQVAMCHLFFNITGIAIFYPIPFMRAMPIHAARQLGKATRQWRGFPFLYIFVMFVILPAICLGISFLFSDGSKGLTVLGSLLVVVLILSLGYLAYWWRFKDGKQTLNTCFERRERVRLTMKDLPDDMEFLKAKVTALMEHTGLPDDDEEHGETDKIKDEDEEEVAA
jgi:sodium-dependent phosphate cotransporter